MLVIFIKENMGLTDFLISFSIIMMMLSIVSERASNFIKLYFQGKIIYIPFLYTNEHKKWKFFLSAKLEILAYSQPTEGAEKEREYRIMIINIIIGIIIAALANANFFEIVKKISSSFTNNDAIIVQGWLMSDINKEKVFGFIYLLIFLWSLSLMLFNKLQENNTNVNQYYVKSPFLIWIVISIIILLLSQGNVDSYFLKIINHTIGYIFIGIFLSLGSKFWHDLLDILFKFKNTQQVLSNNKTYSNYDSADKLMALAETSQYEVAERLFELYKNDISKIEGVVSYGLNTIQDNRSNLFRKIIEVEYTNATAQTQLLELQNSGSIVLNYNTFYLKDYLKILYTSELLAISGIDTLPICYAYNAKSPNSKGSFSVFKKGKKYFAKSNLHVFANDDEFANFSVNPNFIIKNKVVLFVIGNNNPFKGTILEYKFGNYNGYGIDYCICEINKELYDVFINNIDTNKLIEIDENSMSMFGAVSKYLNFHSYRNPTMCTVSYSHFKKELYLFKIGTSTSGISNVSNGDSGSTIYYKIKTTDNSELICTGILVAKSDNYAYMFREI
ncbi:hypothetical protein [Flavobacterium sp.]|uniref:hypothetical protein n=1 Tax=Flavobacterium sp. TaxID=239 RepID=UPI00286D7B46|nr:hypothetical protein [Flavobacterium sp.]